MEELKELFLSLGYTEEEYKEIVNSYSLINLKPATLQIIVKENYDFLISLGYTQEEIIKMTKSLPNIYGYSIENIKQKIEDLKELGYTQEEVIKMTKILPALYGLSIENIKQKIDFYNSIGLSFLPIEDTKQLMQSTKLSYARYRFYEDSGITIDRDNYRKLFIVQKQFEKQYGITKAELLKIYPYPVHKDVKELKEETEEEQKNMDGKEELTKYLKDLLEELESKNGQVQE